MVMQEFELSMGHVSFWFDERDMWEIVEQYNLFVGEGDTREIHHRVDAYGTDVFEVDNLFGGFSFGFGDLAAACLSWATWYPREFAKFVRGKREWRNDGNMTKVKAGEIVGLLISEIL